MIQWNNLHKNDFKNNSLISNLHKIDMMKNSMQLQYFHTHKKKVLQWIQGNNLWFYEEFYATILKRHGFYKNQVITM